MGQHGSSTQPANFAKVKQITVLHVDLVNQCLELAVIQAAGEDGVDDLHHHRHDVNEVGRLGAQFLYLISDRCNLHRDSRHWPKCLLLMPTFMRHVISLMKPAFFGWGFAGWTEMFPSRVAGRTLGLRGPDLARGPEVARPWCTVRNTSE